MKTSLTSALDRPAASYAVESDIQNRSWETEPHMPDPEDAEGEPIHGSAERGQDATA